MPQQVIERKANLTDDLMAVIKACDKEKPSPEDMKALQAAFDKYPDLWRVGGDVFEIAVLALINSETKQASTREAMRRAVDNTKDQLGYKTASGAERLLIEACALAWLRYYLIEYRYTLAGKNSQTITQSDYWDRSLTAAHKRYLKTVETLAKVRRLALPVMQLNVAQSGAKQLNVAQTGAQVGGDHA